MTKLTDKQAAFVANKAGGATIRDAAIAAGYAVGSADVAGQRLMQKPAIRNALKAATKGVRKDDGQYTPPTMPRASYADAKEFLADVMNHAQLPIAVRADAAKQLLPYQHARLGETGKKATKKENAAEISGRGRASKFGPKTAPHLRIVE